MAPRWVHWLRITRRPPSVAHHHRTVADLREAASRRVFHPALPMIQAARRCAPFQIENRRIGV
jgi:hypothetical protein